MATANANATPAATGTLPHTNDPPPAPRGRTNNSRPYAAVVRGAAPPTPPAPRKKIILDTVYLDENLGRYADHHQAPKTKLTRRSIYYSGFPTETDCGSVLSAIKKQI
ncbi:hypothetical protein BGZ83_002149, partial [Gryganskiella cystojenkinii]